MPSLSCHLQTEPLRLAQFLRWFCQVNVAGSRCHFLYKKSWHHLHRPLWHIKEYVLCQWIFLRLLLLEQFSFSEKLAWTCWKSYRLWSIGLHSLLVNKFFLVDGICKVIIEKPVTKNLQVTEPLVSTISLEERNVTNLWVPWAEKN